VAIDLFDPPAEKKPRPARGFFVARRGPKANTDHIALTAL